MLIKDQYNRRLDKFIFVLPCVYKNIYKIYAKYEDNNLIGYKLEINPDGWYDEDTRGGYDTVETNRSIPNLERKSK